MSTLYGREGRGGARRGESRLAALEGVSYAAEALLRGLRAALGHAQLPAAVHAPRGTRHHLRPPPAVRPLVFPRRARSRGAGRGGVPRRTSRRSRGRT